MFFSKRSCPYGEVFYSYSLQDLRIYLSRLIAHKTQQGCELLDGYEVVYGVRAPAWFVGHVR